MFSTVKLLFHSLFATINVLFIPSIRLNKFAIILGAL